MRISKIGHYFKEEHPQLTKLIGFSLESLWFLSMREGNERYSGSKWLKWWENIRICGILTHGALHLHSGISFAAIAWFFQWCFVQ